VRFVCRELDAELSASGEAGARVKALARRLGDGFTRLGRARDAALAAASGFSEPGPNDP
jgi:hypothetical protein